MTTIRPSMYFVQTWGCQMNERDSEIIAGMLDEMGMKQAVAPEEADLMVLNTCCVREKAEQKVYARIGELVKNKKANPDIFIVVCGCMVQQKGVPEHIARRFPEVNLILGTHNLYRLPELLKTAGNKGVLIEVLEDRPESFPDTLPVQTNKLKAKVNISFGCNNFCSYCIVPYVRGREVSRKPEAIIGEITHLAENGCKEVLLLGQNVNSYGNDNENYPDFSDLLLQVAAVEGIRRIRFMTSHPKGFSDKLIDTIAGCEKVCNHVHLPVQAGSTGVLKAMNRGYTRDQYLSLVERIKKNIPGVSLTSDIIVGFPGEKEEDFQNTLDLIRQVRFDSAYTFMYSPRRGTRAASLEDPVSPEVKRERLDRLMEVQNEISLELNREYVGRTVEVLLENRSERKDGRIVYSGRTCTNKIVSVENGENKDLMGQFVQVQITEAKTWSLKGRLV
ncbi:MAG: tRNA (N6-isopentenyl adenosine(37)-C2)-methylthiotransferase MiaB [Bacillota bacterium]|jgi:tRNA-2-methylthio-N6-dimethylallyladenosine synthase